MVSVEGNIASGKSTFLKSMIRSSGPANAGLPELCCFPEPVQEWQRVQCYDEEGSINLLAQYYDDQSGRAAAFQSFILLTQLRQMLRSKAEIRLVERLAGSELFLDLGRDAGHIDRCEYSILKQWSSTLREIPSSCLSPNLIVYLKARPETALARLRERGRREERGVSLDYLQRVHRLHENWLGDKSSLPLNCEVLKIDADQDINSLKSEYNRTRDSILSRAAMHFNI